MTLAEQFDSQFARAVLLREITGAVGLSLVVVRYPHTEPRISVIGASISRGAPEVWRQGGAFVATVFQF